MNYLQSLHVLPLRTIGDAQAASTATTYLDLDNAVGEVELQVQLGTLTSSADVSSYVTITVEASTAIDSTVGAVAIPFHYRTTAAVGIDTMGAVTASGSTGFAVVSTDYANSDLLIYVDPALVAEQGDDYRYISLAITAATGTSAFNYAVTARFVDRYGGNAVSST